MQPTGFSGLCKSEVAALFFPSAFTRGPAAGPARPRRALVLGGGGVLGAAYEVGAIAALEERLGAGRMGAGRVGQVMLVKWIQRRMHSAKKASRSAGASRRKKSGVPSPKRSL